MDPPSGSGSSRPGPGGPQLPEVYSQQWCHGAVLPAVVAEANQPVYKQREAVIEIVLVVLIFLLFSARV